jgi:hypothetical protein
VTRTELRALFRRERARFAAHYPWVTHASLLLVTGGCVEPGRCAYRDLAYADTDALEVVLLERALRLSRSNVLGLVRHELGHLSDALVDAPGREQRADDIAERVTGRRIAYDRRLVQTTGRGTYPRPKRLHR